MRRSSSLVPILFLGIAIPCAAGPDRKPLPAVAEGWAIELAAEAPAILFPTAIVAAPDGTVYLGSDPMDMTGPPTAPIDSVLAIKDGKVRTFADGLWSVMGLEWIDGTLFVVHAPYLSAFRDTDGDGHADARVDLIAGLGPRRPGFSGMNDHVAAGIRLGIDGFLYIAVGRQGDPRGVAPGRHRRSSSREVASSASVPTARAWRSSPAGSATRSPSPSPRPTRSSPTATTTTASDGPTA